MLDLKRKENKNRIRNKKGEIEKYIFFVAILIVPLVQFLIFYAGVNINSILLSLKEYDGNNYVWNTKGLFENYTRFFTGVLGGTPEGVSGRELELFQLLPQAAKNSLVQYLVSLLIILPLGIIVSYYIYSSIPGGGFFKILLMTPQIVSGMVFVIIFKYLYSYGFRDWFENLPDLYAWTGKPTQFYVVMCYDAFFSLAANLILYLGAMANVDKSVMEYGDIDGLKSLGKLWHIVLPTIWPTVIVFIMSGIASFFTSQGSLFSFFGDADGTLSEESYTLGYWMFIKVYKQGSITNFQGLPQAAAAGVSFTLIAAPLVLLCKWALEKFGPRED